MNPTQIKLKLKYRWSNSFWGGDPLKGIPAGRIRLVPGGKYKGRTGSISERNRKWKYAHSYSPSIRVIQEMHYCYKEQAPGYHVTKPKKYGKRG
jgi:hypothetical protein